MTILQGKVSLGSKMSCGATPQKAAYIYELKIHMC